MSNTLVQTAQPVLTGEALLLAQENLLIAALRRPSLSSTMKLTGINERHFPDHLRPAFNIVLTKFDFECGNQCIFRVYDDMASLSLQLKTNGKLQLREDRLNSILLPSSKWPWPSMVGAFFFPSSYPSYRIKRNDPN